MRGLTVILAEPAPARLRTALSLGCSIVALGGRARLFLQEEAVSLLISPLNSPADTRRAAAGLPTLAELFDEALAMPVEVIVCQSGLALAALEADRLDPRIVVGGLVGIIATAGDDRIVLA